ncbi:PEP-CTERM sorting domain-containing protein [Tundrisphaera lichenicola]|uniref:PEP-CTERM sorting domain-containing protein n=1 Tax=Tundrisphaera lichenicola TaxID=2029860 RepID=UPI003EB84975
MTKISRLSACFVLAALALGMSSTTQAAFSYGSQGFADIGIPTINTADINSATSFELGTVVTNGSRTGDFLMLPVQTLIVDGPLTIGDPSTFSLSSTAFGVFQATTITEVAASAGTRAFLVGGLFTGGTAFGTPSSPLSAVMRLSFTQSGGAISDSASLTVAVPEPASVAMLGLAGLTGVSIARRRRSS